MFDSRDVAEHGPEFVDELPIDNQHPGAGRSYDLSPFPGMDPVVEQGEYHAGGRYTVESLDIGGHIASQDRDPVSRRCDPGKAVRQP